MQLSRLSSRAVSAIVCALVISLVALAQSRIVRKTVSKRQAPPVVAAAPSPTPVARTTQANSLPLRRAILYSNGVAYFEQSAHVEGEELTVRVHSNDVDDFH